MNAAIDSPVVTRGRYNVEKYYFFVFVAFVRQKTYQSKFTPIHFDRGPASPRVPYQNEWG